MHRPLSQFVKERGYPGKEETEEYYQTQFPSERRHLKPIVNTIEKEIFEEN